MEIGELRHRITLQEGETTVLENGVEETHWVDKAVVWGKVEHLQGREYYAAAALQAEHTVKFTIRYLAFLTPRHRIKFRGETYTITFIDNQTYQRRFQVIHAQEVSPGG